MIPYVLLLAADSPGHNTLTLSWKTAQLHFWRRNRWSCSFSFLPARSIVLWRILWQDLAVGVSKPLSTVTDKRPGSKKKQGGGELWLHLALACASSAAMDQWGYGENQQTVTVRTSCPKTPVLLHSETEASWSPHCTVVRNFHKPTRSATGQFHEIDTNVPYLMTPSESWVLIVLSTTACSAPLTEG